MKVIKKLHYGWIIVIAAFAAESAFMFTQRAYPLVLPAMKAELGLSHGQMGQIATAFYIAFAIMTIVWGIVADRIGPRKCMLIGQVIIIGGLVSMGFVHSFITGLLFYFLCGTGGAAQDVGTAAIISNWFGDISRGKAMGILLSACGVITLVLGFVIPSISANLSWRWSWWILAAIAPIILFLCWRLLKDKPRDKGLSPVGASEAELAALAEEDNKKHPVPTKSRVSFKDILKHRTIWNIAGITFAWGAGHVVFMTFAVAYLEELLWLPETAASVYALWGALSIPGAIVWGIITDRITKKYLLMIALAVQAVAVFIFLTSNPAARYIGATIFGFSYISVPVILKTTMSDYYEPKVIGSAIGFILGTMGVGMATGPAIAGHLADISGTLHTAILFSLGALVTGFIITLALKKTPKRLMNAITYQ